MVCQLTNVFLPNYVRFDGELCELFKIPHAGFAYLKKKCRGHLKYSYENRIDFTCPSYSNMPNARS